jgi:hypothetical protein
MSSARRQQPRRKLEVVPRSDQMGICNDQQVPVADFQLMFCDRCRQVECTRSRVGDSKFERRVANWERDLFGAPPRMDPQDPRFQLFSAKKFLTIDMGPMPEVRTSSAWVDPRSLNEGASSGIKPVTRPDPEFMKPQPRAIEQNPAPRQQIPGRVAALNTPTNGPRMLNNAPPPAPKPDPWAGPKAPQGSGETVVSPGAKVRTGGSGPAGV